MTIKTCTVTPKISIKHQQNLFYLKSHDMNKPYEQFYTFIKITVRSKNKKIATYELSTRQPLLSNQANFYYFRRKRG